MAPISSNHISHRIKEEPTSTSYGEALKESRDGQITQRVIENSSLNQKQLSSTSYSQMLKQATDGDASEAMVKASVGRRKGEIDEGRDTISGEEVLLHKKSSNSFTQPIPAGIEDDIIKKLRQKKRAGKVTGKHLTEGQFRPPLVERAHDQFQLATSGMKAEEAATFACLEAFLNVTKIFMLKNWMRSTKASDNLMQRQMSEG